jgi:hypothetical protein
MGAKINQLRVSTFLKRKDLLALMWWEDFDMLYLDAHHVPCTEWDIDNICMAASEV